MFATDAGVLVHDHHVGVDQHRDGGASESVVLGEDLDLLLSLDVLPDDASGAEDLAAGEERDGEDRREASNRTTTEDGENGGRH